jgi:hypothetical protein
MALQSIPHLQLMPQMGAWENQTSSAPTAATQLFDAAGDGIAMRYTPVENITIDKAAFRCSAFTSGIVGNDVNVSIQTLNASTGLPTGTVVGSTVGVDVTATGVYEVTGLNASLTAGTNYAVCAVAIGSSNFTLAYAWGSGGGGQLAQPMGYTSNGSGGATSWGKLRAFNFGYALSIGTTAGYISVAHLLGPATFSVESYSDSTNPDERGNHFRVAFPCRLIGAAIAGSFGASGPDMTLYLHGGTTASPTDITSRAHSNVYAQDQGAYRFFYFDSPQTLAINTDYWLGVKQTSENNFAHHVLDYGTDAAADCLWDGNLYYYTRNGAAGAITETKSKVMMVFPLIDKLDDGVSIGGGETAYASFG